MLTSFGKKDKKRQDVCECVCVCVYKGEKKQDCLCWAGGYNWGEQ